MVTLTCMVGNDYQRIIDGVDYWRSRELIEDVYLLFDYKKDKYGYTSQKNVEELTVLLSQNGIEPITVGYNPQSFENVFCTFWRILKKEVGRYKRHVLVDATSTTKEAYGATVTIALMFKNIRIYIVPPNERGWYVPSPSDKSFNEWFLRTRSVRGMPPQEIYLPGQKLKHPSKDEVLVLLKLLDHQGFSKTVTSIINWCECNPRDPVVRNRFSRIIRRLEGKGLVEKRPIKQVKEVHLTNFGRILSEAIKRS